MSIDENNKSKIIMATKAKTKTKVSRFSGQKTSVVVYVTEGKVSVRKKKTGGKKKRTKRSKATRATDWLA